MDEPEKKVEAYWFDYEGARVLIRVPLPPEAPRPPAGDTDPKTRDKWLCALFCHCLLEWHGVTDNGKPLALSEPVKNVLFEHNHRLCDFVLENAIELMRAAEAAQAAAIKDLKKAGLN